MSFTATHSCNPIAIALKFAAWRTKVAIYSGPRERTQSLSNWAYSARCMYRVTGKMGGHRPGKWEPTDCTRWWLRFVPNSIPTFVHFHGDPRITRARDCSDAFSLIFKQERIFFFFFVSNEKIYFTFNWIISFLVRHRYFCDNCTAIYVSMINEFQLNYQCCKFHFYFETSRATDDTCYVSLIVRQNFFFRIETYHYLLNEKISTRASQNDDREWPRTAKPPEWFQIAPCSFSPGICAIVHHAITVCRALQHHRVF